MDTHIDRRKQYIPVLTYFTLATMISLIFRTVGADWIEILKLPYGSYYGMSLLVGIGPFMATIMCRWIFKVKKPVLSFLVIQRSSQ